MTREEQGVEHGSWRGRGKVSQGTVEGMLEGVGLMSGGCRVEVGLGAIERKWGTKIERGGEFAKARIGGGNQ